MRIAWKPLFCAVPKLSRNITPFLRLSWGPVEPLHCLSAAAEIGRLDAERYITQLFARPTDLRDFRALLRDAGFERCMSDRHHSALRKLGCAECDCSTYPGVTTLFDPADIDWA